MIAMSGLLSSAMTCPGEVTDQLRTTQPSRKAEQLRAGSSIALSNYARNIFEMHWLAGGSGKQTVTASSFVRLFDRPLKRGLHLRSPRRKPLVDHGSLEPPLNGRVKAYQLFAEHQALIGAQCSESRQDSSASAFPMKETGRTRRSTWDEGLLLATKELHIASASIPLAVLQLPGILLRFSDQLTYKVMNAFNYEE
jgi:hypothetical protein